MLQLPLTCYLAFLDSGTGLAFWFLFVQVQIIQLQYPTRYLKSNAVTLPLFLCQESREQADYYFISTYATTGYFLTTICKYWIPCYNDIGFSTNLKGIFLSNSYFVVVLFQPFHGLLWGSNRPHQSWNGSLRIRYILYATSRVRHVWTKIIYQAH